MKENLGIDLLKENGESYLLMETTADAEEALKNIRDPNNFIGSVILEGFRLAANNDNSIKAAIIKSSAKLKMPILHICKTSELQHIAILQYSDKIEVYELDEYVNILLGDEYDPFDALPRFNIFAINFSIDSDLSTEIENDDILYLLNNDMDLTKIVLDFYQGRYGDVDEFTALNNEKSFYHGTGKITGNYLYKSKRITLTLNQERTIIQISPTGKDNKIRFRKNKPWLPTPTEIAITSETEDLSSANIKKLITLLTSGNFGSVSYQQRETNQETMKLFIKNSPCENCGSYSCEDNTVYSSDELLHNIGCLGLDEDQNLITFLKALKYVSDDSIFFHSDVIFGQYEVNKNEWIGLLYSIRTRKAIFFKSSIENNLNGFMQLVDEIVG